MTVSCCDGRVTTAVGRAMATTIALSDNRNSSGGRCRRQPWLAVIASLTIASPA
jgi:hypothetical protein